LWRMPDRALVRLDMHVEEDCTPGYSEPLGVDELDGYLGLDFLYQWMPLFDLSGRELMLFDLNGLRE
jgi:hypothetical protein